MHFQNSETAGMCCVISLSPKLVAGSCLQFDLQKVNSLQVIYGNQKL